MDKFKKRFKTFSQEVKESAPAWTESLSTALFDLPRAGLKDVRIPLSPSIFKRLWPKSIRSTAFHVTDYDGVAKLKKMQGKKRSISAFYNMDYDMISYGIRTEGGYVVELEGDVLAAAADDIASAPDKSGRRWITLSTLLDPISDHGFGGGTKLKGFENEVNEMMIEIIMQYADDPVGMPNVNKAWGHLGKEYKNEGKILSQIIRDYIDGMEKIMKKYSRKLGPLFKDYTKKRTLNVDPDSGDVPQWDELVVNNFKIKKIHIGQEWSEDFQDDDDIEGFPFELWQNDKDLSDHIAKIVKLKK
jgi:hypothetical protein